MAKAPLAEIDEIDVVVATLSEDGYSNRPGPTVLDFTD
jgi:hypothetical protein